MTERQQAVDLVHNSYSHPITIDWCRLSRVRGTKMQLPATQAPLASLNITSSIICNVFSDRTDGLRERTQVSGVTQQT